MKKQTERSCISVMAIQTAESEKATFAKFNLKDAKTGEYFGAIAFGGIAEQLAKEITEGGIALTVKGDNRDSDRFKVFSFVINRPKEDIVSEDINIRIAGSPEKLKDLKQRIREQKTKEGHVRIKWGDTYAWMPKEDCIFLSTQWWHKVEYCIELLGSGLVQRRFKNFVKQQGGLLIVNRKDYQQFLDNLVKEANGDGTSETIQPDVTKEDPKQDEFDPNALPEENEIL